MQRVTLPFRCRAISSIPNMLSGSATAIKNSRPLLPRGMARCFLAMISGRTSARDGSSTILSRSTSGMPSCLERALDSSCSFTSPSSFNASPSLSPFFLAYSRALARSVEFMSPASMSMSPSRFFCLFIFLPAPGKKIFWRHLYYSWSEEYEQFHVVILFDGVSKDPPYEGNIGEDGDP